MTINVSKTETVTVLDVKDMPGYLDDEANAPYYGDPQSPGSFKRMIDALQACYASIPEEYQADARIELETEYESSSVQLTVTYCKPRSPEDIAAEVARRKREAEQNTLQEIARLETRIAQLKGH